SMKRFLRSTTICLFSPLLLFSLSSNELYAYILGSASEDYFSFGYYYLNKTGANDAGRRFD
ncbi:MAG: hypothetical protein LBE89_02810, partial [Helicobacteraceae bacterium]|nr:hypothetical protein [Helicobacteraceae bacterium]